MNLYFEQRASDSPFVETVIYGQTTSDGSVIRPAASNWHMVFVRHSSGTYPIIAGPLASAGTASWGKDAEILWIKFKVGVYMPHRPTRNFLDRETLLPDATGCSFWLKSSVWHFPDYENADTFVARLVRDEILVRDPVVSATLRGHPPTASPRTVRHRFLQTTGMTQTSIFQIERAQRAVALLERGLSILDTVEAAGYFDQPHLTRSLKKWVGFTPAQILAGHNLVVT